ncbi:patatin-like phospholipase family protein [Halomonas sp. ML-15]|uniref:CBASS cGAMP-activated phospholipase n=1 Tax=Halomonas sp. ML-15 TaxID=2773305 RepID=UPI0017475238|nr:CBASS cGAMP-activated phospholipase [Halomonas sp. ML-15]MBD3896455.1 patatin-like phospholipase family protein [Halomonas sp. ML-15]
MGQVEAQQHKPWNPEDPEKEFWILSLSGGGYRGLFSAEILKALEDVSGGPLANKFDLIAGTSVGSILASAVAKELPASQLPSLFTEHGEKIFAARRLLGGLIKSPGVFASKYRADALKKFLSREDLLSSSTFNDLHHRLIIPTINLSKGGPQYFKTQHHPRFTQDGRRKIIDAVLASSAAPMYFPVYKFDNNRYADGGLIANSPLLAAIHEAVYILGVPKDKINAVSIGTMGGHLTIDPKMKLEAGLKQWGVNIVLMQMTAQEVMQDFMAGHVIESRVINLDKRQSKEQSGRISLDSVDHNAQEVLQGSASTVVQEKLHDDNILFKKWKEHVAEQPIFFNQEP